VSLHDAQLAALRKHQVDGAKDRLMRVLERGSFPDLTRRPVEQVSCSVDTQT
jgi:hypothetical protein